MTVEHVLRLAQLPQSDALYVWRDGEVLVDWHSPSGHLPLETVSVTKSIVNLAMGRLVYLGRLPSLDVPVSEFFGEWQEGPKRDILVQHLLNQTSGLQADRTTEKIYASEDFVKFALAADLVSPPGATFFYNNRATNLLAGIVEKASGLKLDEFMSKEFFTPLGIREWSWTRDRAGNPHAMSGLALRARDLARLGQMMLDEGLWEGTRLLSADWVAQSSVASQDHNPLYGLLWWLIPESIEITIDDRVLEKWRMAEPPVDEDLIQRILPLRDQVFTRETFMAALAVALGVEPAASALADFHRHTLHRGLPDGRARPSSIIGVYGSGYLGQYLVVLPKWRVIAIHQRKGDYSFDNPREFVALVRQIAEAQ